MNTEANSPEVKTVIQKKKQSKTETTNLSMMGKWSIFSASSQEVSKASILARCEAGVRSGQEWGHAPEHFRCIHFPPVLQGPPSGHPPG